MTIWTAPDDQQASPWAQPVAGQSLTLGMAGTTSWNSPNRLARGSTETDQTDTYSNHDATSYLYARGYALGIPASATILGVEVRVNAGSTQSPSRVDTHVQLALAASAATLSSANRAVGSPLAPEEVRVYGAADDPWGEALTPALVNDANFGVVFKLGPSATMAQSSIRTIGLRVTYEIVEDGAVRVTQARAAALITQPSAVRVTAERLNVFTKSQGFARVTAARVEVIRSLTNGVVDVARRRRQMFLIGD